ncbi:DUF4372 domain-containing protein [Aquimarina addita]|uniref:DUF4372 domain-containing protein n=1 Tax=Aquimarina addita TaxID=870485 RepID=UPI0031E8559D
MLNVTFFSQIVSKLDKSRSIKLVDSYQSDRYKKGFTSWSHMVSILFCQFAKSQSVHDISNGLRSATANFNHLVILKAPSKSTLSYQNKKSSWEFFKDYYYVLLENLG